MKIIKNSFCVLLILLLLTSSVIVYANDTAKQSIGATSGTIGECTWSFNSGVLTIYGNGSMGNDQGNSYPWKDLGDSITSVVIGNGVTDVAGHAFLYQQKISSVSISNTVTKIGAYAFGQCIFTSIVIPDSVKTIEYYAFHSCSYLSNVKIGSGVYYIGSYAFKTCKSLKSVTIPKSVTSIGSEAFGCSADIYTQSPNPNFILYGYPSSAAEKYANDTGVRFQSIDSSSPILSLRSITNLNTAKVTTTFNALDDGILSGYYWGINQNYSYNTFISSNKNEIVETITLPGTYYCTAKDTAEKISNTESIRINQAIFDANGGSVSKTNSLYMGEDTLTMPEVERDGYDFSGWEISSVKSVSVNDEATITTYYASWKKIDTPTTQPVIKKAQKITAKSYTKTYGSKAFNLNAKTSGNGKLTYKSSNKKVATVSFKGKITIKGCGKTTVTIKASATSKYKATSKKITITVKLGKAKIKSCKQEASKRARIRITKIKGAKGYQFQLTKSGNSYLKTTPAKKGTFSVSGLSKGKWKIKIRAYGTFSKKKYYGAWSTVKSFKITY